ncbi:hypothetical protein BDZ45DRAFT_737945 [Acephala macrosclerotiorum]|nr:hypothetical protein BDZ45DRAFT_737945 [Acephala macrosclerotiorum]
MYPFQNKAIIGHTPLTMLAFGQTSGLRSQVSPWTLAQESSPRFTKPANTSTKAEIEIEQKSRKVKPKGLQLKDLFEELFGEGEATEKFTFDDLMSNVISKEDLQSLSNATVKSKSFPSRSTRPNGTTFTVFPKLPIELRTMIWTSSLPGSRTVEINRTRQDDNTAPEYRSPAIIPAALHVCQESRTIAQEHYSLSFGSSIWEDAGRVWFDKNIDVTFFNCRRLSHHREITRFFMWAGDIDKIQHLGMCGAACESLVASLANNEVLVERLKKNMKVQSMVCTSHGTSFSRKNLRIESLKTPIEAISVEARQAIEIWGIGWLNCGTYWYTCVDMVALAGAGDVA